GHGDLSSYALAKALSVLHLALLHSGAELRTPICNAYLQNIPNLELTFIGGAHAASVDHTGRQDLCTGVSGFEGSQALLKTMFPKEHLDFSDPETSERGAGLIDDVAASLLNVEIFRVI